MKSYFGITGSDTEFSVLEIEHTHRVNFDTMVKNRGTSITFHERVTWRLYTCQKSENILKQKTSEPQSSLPSGTNQKRRRWYQSPRLSKPALNYELWISGVFNTSTDITCNLYWWLIITVHLLVRSNPDVTI